MQLYNKEFAYKIEFSEASRMLNYQKAHQILYPNSNVVCQKIDTGYAMFAGIGSPLSQAFGLGFAESLGENAISELVNFYEQNNCSIAIEVANLADISLTQKLNEQGFKITELSHVLVLNLNHYNFSTDKYDFLVQKSEQIQANLLSKILSSSFFDGAEAPEIMNEIIKTSFYQDNAYIFNTKQKDSMAGVGALFLDKNLAFLGGAGVLPQFRNQGMQKALLAVRLKLAKELNCDYAIVSTAPGTVSQMNMQKLGFEIAYARIKFEK